MMETTQQGATPQTLERLSGHVLRERPHTVRVYMTSLYRNKAALIGALLLITIVVAAITAPWISPHDPQRQSLPMRLTPPAWQEGGTWTHPLGTDALGRDLLSRLIFGTRISLIVGLSAVAVQGLIGITLGLIAGYYGGRTDSIIMRLTDIQYALPFIILAIAIMAVLGPSLRNVIIVLGITGWVYYARIVRAEVLTLRRREFVEAAIAMGARSSRLMARHLLPNVVTSIIVVGSLQVARMIISEASLSFLGLGVPPNIPSWGVMVAEGRGYVATAWWVSALSGAAIFVTVMSVNLVGDWLRDQLDPTMTGERSGEDS
jgi:peptide/nickel transport system permease protein